MLCQSGSLILSTSSTTNPCTINASKTDFTFSNIDMKNVLGDAWDKYEMFAMKVVTATPIGAITTGNSAQGVLTYNMAGLTWENLHYDTAYMSQRYVPIATILIQTSVPNINQTISNTGQSYNFRKGNRFVDLNFTLTNFANIGGPSTFGQIPGANFNDISFHLVFEPVIPGEMNECAFFGFNTVQTISSQVGRTVTNRIEFNYASFDMRRLCREFWNKHDDFEIQLAFTSNIGIGVASGNGRPCLFQLNGLNFINSATKNSNQTSKLGLTNESPIIGAIVFSTSASGHECVMSIPYAPIQFKKGNDNVNLTINLRNHDNTGPFAFSFTGANPQCLLGLFIKPIYKMEKATLMINPSGLTTSQTNLGIINSNSTEFTLNNIDMRNVCCSMWDKYKKFNIFLTSSVSFDGASQLINGAYILQMEGFDFINQTAWITSPNQTQVATLGSFSTGKFAAPQAMGWQSGIVTTFYKTQDLVNLKLRALPIAPSTPFTNTPLLCNFTFTIVGIPEDEEQAKQFTQNLMK